LKTREAITEFGWTVLHPPHYSPDLASSDFHLFGAVKNANRGTIFETDGDVIRAVRTWLLEHDKVWYRQDIHILNPRWLKAVEVDGDFVEKIGYGDKPSLFIMCNLHYLGMNIYWEKI
jgi:histone-lysine N-methyltransferase SETMAR